MARLICLLLWIFFAANLAIEVTCSLAGDIVTESSGNGNKTSRFLDGTQSEKFEDFFLHLDKPWNSDKQFQFHLRALAKAYPSQLLGVKCDHERLWILMRFGDQILYDDGKKKTTQEKMKLPDLEDSMFIPYPLENISVINDPDSDPGRIRNDTFLKAVYGGSISAVKRNLGLVNFCGRMVRFNTANGAAKSLEKVAEKLCPQIHSSPVLKPYLDQIGGTFKWRKIAGTNRMSAHSYGIAIDLNPKTGEYWRSYHGQLAGFRRNGFPEQIVTAFEEQGFIWGGEWYHFDLMHFEYRPELLNMAHENKPESASIVKYADKKN